MAAIWTSYRSMATVLYCLEGKVLSAPFPACLTYRQRHWPVRLLAQLRSERRGRRSRKCKNSPQRGKPYFLPWCPSVVYLLRLLSLCPPGGAFRANAERQITDGWKKGEQNACLCLATQICPTWLCWSYTSRSRAQQGAECPTSVFVERRNTELVETSGRWQGVGTWALEGWLCSQLKLSQNGLQD